MSFVFAVFGLIYFLIVILIFVLLFVIYLLLLLFTSLKNKFYCTRDDFCVLLLKLYRFERQTGLYWTNTYNLRMWISWSPNPSYSYDSCIWLTVSVCARVCDCDGWRNNTYVQRNSERTHIQTQLAVYLRTLYSWSRKKNGCCGYDARFNKSMYLYVVECWSGASAASFKCSNGLLKPTGLIGQRFGASSLRA